MLQRTQIQGKPYLHQPSPLHDRLVCHIGHSPGDGRPEPVGAQFARQRVLRRLVGREKRVGRDARIVGFDRACQQCPSARAGADRGKKLFEAKAGCIRCHAGPDYTTSKTYTLDIEADGSPFDRWNPPSLRGVRDRSPLMHAAQAPDLDALLRLYHKPEDLGGKALDAAERADLIAFLKSLD